MKMPPLTLEEAIESMEFNGYAYFDTDAFFNEATRICYVPENAESLDDAYTYLDLRDLVASWAKDNPNYLIEHETTEEAILLGMFENIEWAFPETYLQELI